MSLPFCGKKRLDRAGRNHPELWDKPNLSFNQPLRFHHDDAASPESFANRMYLRFDRDLSAEAEPLSLIIKCEPAPSILQAHRLA